MATRKHIKAQIRLAMSLIHTANQVFARIFDDIGEDNINDAVFKWRDDIMDMQYGDSVEDACIEAVFKGLEETDGLKGIEEGNDCPSYMVDMQGIWPVIKAPVDGGELQAYVGESDFGTIQAGIQYEYEKSPFDLAMAEIKRGELATNVGLAEDNKDIDLYTWGNVYSEDFTDRARITYDEIKSAICE